MATLYRANKTSREDARAHPSVDRAAAHWRNVCSATSSHPVLVPSIQVAERAQHCLHYHISVTSIPAQLGTLFTLDMLFI